MWLELRIFRLATHFLLFFAMPPRPRRDRETEIGKFLRDLLIWGTAIAVELALRWLLSRFSSQLGLADGSVERAHRYMNFLLWTTLMSTLTFTAGEVLSIGLRRLLREFARLVEQFREFLAAFKRKKGEQ